MKRRDPVAKALRTPEFKQRVVPDHKKYDPNKDRHFDWKKELEEYDESVSGIHTPKPVR